MARPRGGPSPPGREPARRDHTSEPVNSARDQEAPTREAPAGRGLRFALVTTFYPPYHFGGDAVFVRRLAHALARRGHEVEVIHDIDAYRLFHRGPPPATLAEPERVRTHPLHSRLGAFSCLATQQTGRPVVHGRRIRRILERGRFDVIHFHNVSLVGGPGVLAYGTAIKLYTVHEYWLLCPSHALWRHDRELCTGRQCLRCVLRHRRPPQLWRSAGLLERRARIVDAWISPSAFAAAKHAELGFRRDFEVIPPFLPDLDSGAETEPAPGGESHSGTEGPGAEGSAPYFLFVGRLEKLKGLQDVLPLFGADAPADLLVAGTGGYEPALRRLAADLPRVRFLGFCAPKELRRLYRRARAVIVPSLCWETFGLVPLEAFRDRTPVVARARGALTEVVRQSGGGLLFESREELAAAVRRLAGDAELRARLGDAGHRTLLEHWVESAALGRYLDLIRRLAARREGSGKRILAR